MVIRKIRKNFIPVLISELKRKLKSKAMKNLASKKKDTISLGGLPKYQPIDDLWVITSYFNPHHYKSRFENFKIFKKSLENGNINYIVIELAFGTDPFELEKFPNLIQVRGKNVMWQKERLINLAVKYLPRSCKKVAWLDCDILFTNPEWAVETSRLLDSHTVVQPFENIVRLSKDQIQDISFTNAIDGFAKVYKHEPNLLVFGTYPQHGETGFAWATKKRILEKCGLYDAAIAGGADHLMAHAFCGDWDSDHLQAIVQNQEFLAHFQEWSKEIYKHVRSKVTYATGSILHLWHGELQDRCYIMRRKHLNENRYNPHQDIEFGLNELWEWSSNKPGLRAWFRDYFKDRKEDGIAI